MALPNNVIKLTSGETARRLAYPEALKLYHACRERLLAAIEQSFFAQSGPLQDRLMEAAESAPTMDMRNVYYAAQGVLRDRSRELSQALATLLPSDPQSHPTVARASLSLDDLKLVDDDDLDQTLAITKASSRLSYQCAEPLTALEQRLAVLLGDASLGDERNPLGPRRLCQIFVDACARLGLSGDTRLTLLQQFDRAMGQSLPQVYQDINHQLAERGILPNMRVGQGESAARRTPGAEPAGRPPETPGEADVFELLRRALMSGLSGAAPAGAGMALPGTPLAGMPGSAPMAGAAALFGIPGAAQGAGPGLGATAGMAPMVALVPRLTALQRVAGPGTGTMDESAWGSLAPATFASGDVNILRELKGAPAMAGAGELDAMVIDIVAMLFDFIFDDAAIPAPIKALIGRLQIPVLKVAMLDRKFFSHKHHPARHMLDKLAEMALGWNGQTDSPLYRRIETTVHAVLEGFDDNLDIFETLAEELEQDSSQDETANARQVEASIDGLEREERGEIAGIMAEDQIRRLIAPETPDTLRVFLRDTWTRVLERAYAEGGEEGHDWLAALDTASQLAWSASPKRDVRERLKLVQVLPGLLKALRAGMDSIMVPGEARDAFFAQLVTIHAAAVRMGLTPPATVAPVETSVETGAAPDADTTVQVADSTAPAPSSTEAQPAAEVAAPAEIAGMVEDDAATAQVRALNLGDWMEFHREGPAEIGQAPAQHPRRAKLSWISARRGIYLFTNTDGMESFSISSARLADRLRGGEARILDNAPLTERAVSSLIARLMPDAPPGAA